MESISDLFEDEYAMDLVRMVRLFDAGEWEGTLLERTAKREGLSPVIVRSDLQELMWETDPGRARP